MTFLKLRGAHCAGGECWYHLAAVLMAPSLLGQAVLAVGCNLERAPAGGALVTRWRTGEGLVAVALAFSSAGTRGL